MAQKLAKSFPAGGELLPRGEGWGNVKFLSLPLSRAACPDLVTQHLWDLGWAVQLGNEHTFASRENDARVKVTFWKQGLDCAWMDGWMDGWTSRWMDGWMDG